MTNFEKYKEKLLSFIRNHGSKPPILGGAFVLCDCSSCEDCEYGGIKDCFAVFIKWLYEDDGAGCSPDAGKPKGGCKGCHYEGNSILNMPCCHCERTIMDCFEPKKKSEKKPEKKTKTRQSEFLKAYPNAETNQGIIDICPRNIDKDFDECKNYSIGCCVECQRDYWLQEVEK